MIPGSVPLWKRRESGPPEGWQELRPPTFPPDFPAPELEEDVAAYVASALFLAQVRGEFPRCSGQAFEAAGLPGHGVLIHLDERKSEDDAFRITVSRDRRAPQPPPTGDE
jgi:hypothetical protein